MSCILLSACGDELPPPRTEKPEAPAQNDPAYAIRGAHPWWIIANKATQTDDTMQIIVEWPSGTDYIDAHVADLPVVRLQETTTERTSVIEISVTDVPAGTHEILLSANGSTTAFAKLPLYRSAPYYVLVTTDWDFADPGDNANTYQDILHRDHPELRMTHFVGPYTFTDPMLTPARRQALVAWLVKQRDMFRDEIALHIHPYCNFVESAGLTCVTDQSTVYATDATGYTIKLGAYNRTQMGTLLQHASDLFAQNGLDRPKTFRAGGWTATLDTIQALNDKGFTADTSALNWKRIEEWQGQELYRWNMENWNPIDDKSQPYFPSETNVLLSSEPRMKILEVPDNGVLIDYVTLAEMNGLFDTNWNGQPLEKPVTLMMGFHPATPGFSEAEYLRVNGFLKYADMKLATHHLGPVVYITLDDVVAAFQP